MLRRSQVGRSRLQSLPGSSLGFETGTDVAARGGDLETAGSSFAGVRLHGAPTLGSGAPRPSSATRARPLSGIPPALIEHVSVGLL
jgi:hypothetical protein